MRTGDRLRRLGFDDSVYDRSSGHWRVRCPRCQAVTVNGVPCHESGCVNAKAKRKDRR